MDLLIIDASVGAKWLFEEEESQKALRLLGQFEERQIRIVVPEIFYSELASVCRKKVRKKISSAAMAIEALDRVTNLSLERYSDFELSDVALENSLRFGISAYDGLYIALAEMYLAPLITADEKLFKACKNRFDFIEFLGDIETN